MESNLNFNGDGPLKKKKNQRVARNKRKRENKDDDNHLRWPDIHTAERSEINSGRSLKSRLMGTLNPSTESPSRCGYLPPSAANRLRWISRPVGFHSNNNSSLWYLFCSALCARFSCFFLFLENKNPPTASFWMASDFSNGKRHCIAPIVSQRVDKSRES